MQVRFGDGRYVLEYANANDWKAGAKTKHGLRSRLEDALEISAALRAQGYDAKAFDNYGECREPEAYVAPIEHASVRWRGITPSRAGDKWVHVWRDYETNTSQNITADTPQGVIDKLRDLENAHPIIARYLKTLPPEPGTPAAPTFRELASKPVADGRVLRPADNRHGLEDLPERRVESANVPSQQMIAFEKYIDSLSSAEMKERLKDPAFVSAVNALPAKKSLL